MIAAVIRCLLDVEIISRGRKFLNEDLSQCFSSFGHFYALKMGTFCVIPDDKFILPYASLYMPIHIKDQVPS